MFGIGLPEMILIMAVALIVVGPDKLPDLAKSLAKQFFELKKAAQSLKENFSDELEGDRKPWEKAPPNKPQIGALLHDNFERAQPPGAVIQDDPETPEMPSAEESPLKTEDSAEKENPDESGLK